MYTKRELFQRPSISAITGCDVTYVPPQADTIARYVRHLGPGASLRIEGSLLFDETPGHYKKHAQTLDITSINARTPMRRLEQALQRSNDSEYSGYSWRGFAPDTRTRVVPLVKLLEGAKLFAYEANKSPEGPRVGVRVYDDAEGAAYDGAAAAVEVSRRTSKESNHLIVLTGIPLAQGASWRNIATSGSCCIDNKFSNVRFTGLDDPKRKIFCSHEIAAYWKVAATLYKDGNDAPARVSPFVAPAQELIDFYRRLSTRVAVREGKRNRLVNEAEMEQVLQAYVRMLPFGHMFSNKGKLAERQWKH